MTHFAGVQLDITDKVTTSRILEEQVAERTKAFIDSQQRLALASSVSGLGIWEWDLLTNELVWDEHMHVIYETPEAIKQSHLYYDFWLKCLHPDDIERATGSLANAIQAKQTWDSEYRLKLANGKIKNIKATAAVKHDEQGKPIKVIGSNIDITKQCQLELQLTQSVEAAKKANQAKSDFLANMSHEIRTPMNGVLGMTELIKTTLLNSRQKEYLGMIESSAKSLLHLLNDILDLSKIEAGQLSLDPVPTLLDECVGDVMKGFAVAAHNKGLEIYYYIHPDVPACIHIDRLRLSQILFNLVGNAVKFTQSGEVALDISSDQEAIKVDDHFNLKILVRDTGIGIAKHKQVEIFNPFHQADSSITRKYGGTGLGLPIVVHLVGLMDGSISLESQVDQGTVIELSLPARCCSNQPLLDKPEQRQLSRSFTALRTLAVDDNPINLRWLKDMVLSWGSRIDIASSVDEALKIIELTEQQDDPINILLTDKNMPEKSGFDLVHLIHEAGFKKPAVIIMLSSSELESDIQTAHALGIEQFILKPVKQSEVFNAILNALDKQHNPGLIPQAPTAGSAIKSLNILAAEDNPINQRIINDILEQRGHAITLVDNGAVAVRLSEKQFFDVVLMDVQMPEMDGFEATRRIRQAQQAADARSRIIGVSAHALKGDKELALQAGMDDYLTKPLYAEQLIKVVEQSIYDRKVQANDREAQPNNRKAQASSTASTETPVMLFDKAHATRVTANDTRLLLKICSMVQTLLPEMLSNIDQTVYEQAGTHTKEQLHKLAGMVSNVAHQAFINDLKYFEKTIKDELTDHDAQQWVRLRKQLTQLKHELETFTDED